MIIVFVITLLIFESFIAFKKQVGIVRVNHLLTNFLFIIPSKITSLSIFYFISKDFYGHGLLNIVKLNSVVVTIFSLIILDFFLWLQHYYSHKINFLWALHKVHHCDLVLDVSSAARFHPLEILLSLFYKLFVVYIFGISKENYFLFEMITGTCAIFTHANVRLPAILNSLTSFFLITPNLHQVHHSNENKLMNSNFGNTLSLWDKVFNCFVKFEDTRNLELGLKDISASDANHFLKLLLLPFYKVKRP